MINTLLKQLMADRNLKQSDMADLLEVSIDRVKSLTSGRVKNLSREEGERLIRKLQVRAEWLATGEGEMIQSEGEQEFQRRSGLLKGVSEIARNLTNDEDQRRLLQEALFNEGMKKLQEYQAGANTVITPHLIKEQQPPAYLQSAPKLDESSFVMVPRYDVRASAGTGAVIHSEIIVDHLAFKQAWVTQMGLSKKDLALIEVQGDSMEPTLVQSDLILIDLRESKLNANGIYAIQHAGNLFVKRIQLKFDGSVVIKSDNPNYDAETLTPAEAEALVVVGRVAWFGRQL